MASHHLLSAALTVEDGVSLQLNVEEKALVVYGR